MNYAHKQYKNHTTPTTDFINPEGAEASYIRAAAKYMRRAVAHIQAYEIQERSDVSDKACLLLSGIVVDLEENTPEQKKVATHLKNYFKTMIELILKMNMLNDAKLAAEIAKQLDTMAQSWEDMAAKKSQLLEDISANTSTLEKENPTNLGA